MRHLLIMCGLLSLIFIISIGVALFGGRLIQADVLAVEIFPDIHLYDSNRHLLYNLRLMPDAYDGEPAWSPDGHSLIFVGEARHSFSYELFKVTFSPFHIEQLFFGGTTGSRVSSPAWSPDGTQIAFVSNTAGNRDIYVVNADGGGVLNVIQHPSVDFAPSWSPDGESLSFTRENPHRQLRGYNFDIITLQLADEIEIQHTTHTGGDMLPAWSPDGDVIAFFSDRDSGFAEVQLHLLHLDTDEIEHINMDQPLTLDPGALVWSPDGHRLAFTAIHHTQVGIWVWDSLTNEVQQLTQINHALVTNPSWRP